MSPEEIARAVKAQEQIFFAVWDAIARAHPVEGDPNEAGVIQLLPTVDGLLGVLANLIVQSGAFPTRSAERRFVDHLRNALFKHISDAKRDAGSEVALKLHPLDLPGSEH